MLCAPQYTLGAGRRRGVLKNSFRLIPAIAAMSVLGLALWAQAPQKNYKDRGEYDLFAAITKETNPTQKLTLLNQLKEKYPQTEFKD